MNMKGELLSIQGACRVGLLNLQFSIPNPQSNNPRSNNPQSNNPRSTIPDQQSTISNQQSAISLPHLTLSEWILAASAAIGIGIGKSGLAGMSLVHVLIFAFLFGARDSTGVVLPMLLVGDVCAVRIFHRHARWDYVRRMLPPACIGVVCAAIIMRSLDEAVYKPIIGVTILVLTTLQVVRMAKPQWFGKVPHARWFAWTLGLTAGGATMLANAAGPIFTIYCLAIGLPKFEL